MKVNRRNPLHWLWLALFLVNALIACALRPFLHRGRTRRVLFYGHKLSGNLAHILRELRVREGAASGEFLTMDPEYCRELAAGGESAVLATSPRAIHILASADAVVCDHGIHSLLPLLWWSDLAFIDAWHGIPFKGFDEHDFRIQHRFDECWVASPSLRALYVDRFGFAPHRVVPTGYARTDVLVRREGDPSQTRRALGLPLEGRIVTFAPTWAQDDADRTPYPFGASRSEFLGMLSATVVRHGAIVVVRTHLNSGAEAAPELPGLHWVPFAQFPDTEQLLLATDILVCDWSSIAFDYLLLARPTIFLDVPPPFAKPLSLGPEFRYGQVVGSNDALAATLDRYLAEPGAYERDHGSRARRVRDAVYGDAADGHAAARCVSRLARFTDPIA